MDSRYLLSRIWGNKSNLEFWTRNVPLFAFREIMRLGYQKLPFNLETNIMKEDWDVLIILDGCRVDTFREMAGDYDYLSGDVDSIWSVGSSSQEWMDNTFTESDLSDIVYVTGNPFSDSHAPESEFAELHEVWRSHWDDDIGTIPARPITNRAIDTARRAPSNRLIIHYMQPHLPSIPDPITTGVSSAGFGEEQIGSWELLKQGSVSVDTVKQAYNRNLEYILNEVEMLIKNIDANKIVLTSDHGHSFGEWGQFGHPVETPAPVVRKVPWAVTNGVDRGTHKPDLDDGEPHLDKSVESRLRDLGYTQ